MTRVSKGATTVDNRPAIIMDSGVRIADCNCSLFLSLGCVQDRSFSFHHAKLASWPCHLSPSRN